ncbi:MAG: hypothetical protein ACOYMF_14625 [Bacteroidales bacterium]
MKLVNIPISYNSNCYCFHKWLGGLIEKKQDNYEIEEPWRNNKKFRHVYEQILDPYLLSQQTIPCNIPHYSKTAVLYAKILIRLCKQSFLIAVLFSKLNLLRFENAKEAVMVFRDIFPKQEQKNLCLPRSLFVASSSKAFKKSGVLFIGVFLPSRNMHAWIIENNENPDISDEIWICYQPVLAII